MNQPALVEVARTLVGRGKGILAMDESDATCNERFAAAGIPQTEEARRAWRELLITTPQLGECISGAILYDETIRQRTLDGTPFTEVLLGRGIIPGIKVDIGTTDLAGHPGEKVTEGLDGLRARLEQYVRLGARFAKWRAVIEPGGGLPSLASIEANTHALARYAALCQEAGLVPIVEPEVLMDRDHSLQRSGGVSEDVLRAVFRALHDQAVALEAVILKPYMVLPGLNSPEQATVEDVANATFGCLMRTVPGAVAGIAFLSGGQSGELASARLNAINLWQGAAGRRAPWPLVFSFARAIQQPALQIWRGEEAHRVAAQQAVLHRARCNQAAIHGNYRAAMEAEATLEAAL
ncbi:MAG: fructose-bisphosphate aldolase class I [Caulobacter sp.]|nr:fructose-bisphosphate aldolase class I [Vitreoscilla sp.]